MSQSLKPEEWQKLFNVQGLRFFITDIWTDFYKSLGVLVVFVEDTFTSFLPHQKVEETLQQGVELLSNAEEFEKYIKEFRSHIQSVNALSQSWQIELIEKDQVEELFTKIARLFHFYSKTEFFFTDGIYKKFKETKSEELEKRLEEIGKMKNEGREHLNSIFFGEDALLVRLLQSLEKRFSVPERHLHQYSRSEILLLFEGIRVQPNIIAERDKAFYFLASTNELIIKTGEEAYTDIQSFKMMETISAEAIRGQTANGGRAQGRVKVMKMGFDLYHKLPQMIAEMDEGDVLVAETTSPEYMLACKKAAAIVTDQGGMLSHAAIVSRELGIPCIVGTGNATDVFKDGDLVEVDADTGIVKLLEKN